LLGGLPPHRSERSVADREGHPRPARSRPMTLGASGGALTLGPTAASPSPFPMGRAVERHRRLASSRSPTKAPLRQSQRVPAHSRRAEVRAAGDVDLHVTCPKTSTATSDRRAARPATRAATACGTCWGLRRLDTNGADGCRTSRRHFHRRERCCRAGSWCRAQADVRLRCRSLDLELKDCEPETFEDPSGGWTSSRR